MSLPRLALLLLCFALALAAAPPPSDPGIVLRVEGEEFVLRALDARDDADGPALRVALGSPARPTPRGSFALERVVLNPAWTPGTDAREAGARPLPPSSEGPMGVAKIPFAADGAFALHGGARSYLLGKQISSGCIRAADPDLLRLIDWLASRGALAEEVPTPEGERHRAFLRPVWLRVE